MFYTLPMSQLQVKVLRMGWKKGAYTEVMNNEPLQVNLYLNISECVNAQAFGGQIIQGICRKLYEKLGRIKFARLSLSSLNLHELLRASPRPLEIRFNRCTHSWHSLAIAASIQRPKYFIFMHRERKHFNSAYRQPIRKQTNWKIPRTRRPILIEGLKYYCEERPIYTHTKTLGNDIKYGLVNTHAHKRATAHINIPSSASIQMPFNSTVDRLAQNASFPLWGMQESGNPFIGGNPFGSIQPRNCRNWPASCDWFRKQRRCRLFIRPHIGRSLNILS